MFFFAFSTIIGWYFFGQANVKYLFGPKAVKVYSVLVAGCVVLGSLAQVDLVWNMADCFNSMMVLPNIDVYKRQREEIEKITEYTFKVNEVLKKFFADAGIELIDFKIEFGRFHGNVILADEISPDTCRLWDINTHEKLDKDRFRRDMGNVEDAYQEVFRRIGIK